MKQSRKNNWSPIPTVIPAVKCNMTGENSCDFSLNIWGGSCKNQKPHIYTVLVKQFMKPTQTYNEHLILLCIGLKRKKTYDKFFCRTQPV